MSEHLANESQGDFTVTPRVLVLSLLAIAIGLVSTGVAFVLLRLIGLFTNLFYFQNPDVRKCQRGEILAVLRSAGRNNQPTVRLTVSYRPLLATHGICASSHSGVLGSPHSSVTGGKVRKHGTN